MKLERAMIWGSVLVGVTAGAWAFSDHFGFRPALKIEVDAVKEDVEVVGKSVAWLQLESYERRIRRGQQLSRRDCAKYRALARLLNVKPLRC